MWSIRRSPISATRLTEALFETGATIAFDAIGGGPLAGHILGAMEAALVRKTPPVGGYGSPVHKQVYIYGRLDLSPTTLAPNMGFAWSVGGFLLTPFLMKSGRGNDRAVAPARRRRNPDDLRQRLHVGNLAGRSDPARHDPRLAAQGDGREISDQPDAVTRRPACRI